MKDGNDLATSGDYVDALAKFDAAYQIVPSPKLLLNIGTTQRLLGRNADAATTYQKYLTDPGRDPKREDEVRKLIADIDRVVARIRIWVSTKDAIVKLDGREIGHGQLDATVRVDPGQHTVLADKPGMSAGVVTETLAAGQAITIQAEPAPPTTVESGRIQRIAGIVVGSAGVASAIVGGVMGGLALKTNNDAKKECSTKDPTLCSQKGVDLGKTATTYATTSTVTLAVGGGLFAVGTIMFVTAPRRKGPTSDSAPRASGFQPVAVWAAPTFDGGFTTGMAGVW